MNSACPSLDFKCPIDPYISRDATLSYAMVLILPIKIAL